MLDTYVLFGAKNQMTNCEGKMSNDRKKVITIGVPIVAVIVGVSFEAGGVQTAIMWGVAFATAWLTVFILGALIWLAVETWNQNED